MKRGTSLYLDVDRFAAALMVFLEHLRVHTKNSFGHFWAAHPFWYSHSNVFSQTAVTVFFVLSDYVIAHVLATRERMPLDYATSRLARLYSVILPALLLTAACNYLIEQRYPEAFQAFNSDDVSFAWPVVERALVSLVGGTFLTVMTLGRFCENTKGIYKRFSLAAWSSVALYAARLVRTLLQVRLGWKPPVPAVELLGRSEEVREWVTELEWGATEYRWPLTKFSARPSLWEPQQEVPWRLTVDVSVSAGHFQEMTIADGIRPLKDNWALRK